MSLQKVEINRIPNGNLERVIRATFEDLEKRKNKATRRPDTGICGQILKLFNDFCMSFCHQKWTNGCNLGQTCTEQI